LFFRHGGLAGEDLIGEILDAISGVRGLNQVSEDDISSRTYLQGNTDGIYILKNSDYIFL
jgi:hypothetical protein